jgi:hypothetical protein
VTPESRDQILDAIEEAFQAAGASSYDDGIQTVIRLFDELQRSIQLIKTREHAATLLDLMPELPVHDEPLVVAAAKFLPQLLAMNIGQVVDKLVADFKPHISGRPRTLADDRKLAVVDYMGQLHLDGNSITVCKRYAARRFKVSVRTVERAWHDRTRIREGERKITLQEAQAWVSKILSSAPEQQSLPAVALDTGNQG